MTQIIKATQSDGAGLAKVVRDSISAAYPGHYSEAWIRMKLRYYSEKKMISLISRKVVFKAVEDGVVVGCAVLFPRVRYLSTLFVAPDRLRIGIGSLLLEAVLEVAGVKGMWTVGSKVGKGFYLKRGFVEVLKGHRLLSKPMGI